MRLPGMPRGYVGELSRSLNFVACPGAGLDVWGDMREGSMLATANLSLRKRRNKADAGGYGFTEFGRC